MSSFQDLGVFRSHNHEAEAQRSYAHAALNRPSLWSMRVTPFGFCLRVIVNEKTLKLEKTTSSVLSVIVT